MNVRVQMASRVRSSFIIERIAQCSTLDAAWTTIARTLGADPGLASHISRPGCEFWLLEWL